MATLKKETPGLVEYRIDNAPWCFAKPTAAEVSAFSAQFSKAVLNDFFAKLRAFPNLSHHAIVTPEVGGITAGEMALMHLRRDMATRRNRKQQRKKDVQEGTSTAQPQSKKPKFCMWNNIPTVQ